MHLWARAPPCCLPGLAIAPRRVNWSLPTPTPIDNHRVDPSTAANLDKWLKKVQEKFSTTWSTVQPECIDNLDETVRNTLLKPKVVLVERGPDPAIVIGTMLAFQLLICGNAANGYMRPTLVLKRKREVPREELIAAKAAGIDVATEASGHFTSDLFGRWLGKVFVKALPRGAA